MKNKKGGQPNNKNAEIWTKEKAMALAFALIEWQCSKPTNMFYEDFLCIEKRISKDTINYLSKKFKSFSDLIKKAADIQEVKLRKWGTAGKLNPTMAIFCLKNNHGYTDKVDHTSKGQKINQKYEIEIIDNQNRTEASK